MTPLTSLGPGDPPDVRSAYPHMLSEDTVVWSQFLRETTGLISRCWYDVHVGDAVTVPTDVPPEIQIVSRAVTRKRIDVVALMGSVYHVVEVKPWGGYTALGQALVYWRLFRSEYPDARPSLPYVVCSTIDPDCRDDFDEHGIGLYRVTLH